MSKQLLPTIKRGGYSLRFRFMDEGRGERFFDTEYAARRIDKNKFQITGQLNYRGEYVRGGLQPAHTIGKALTKGTQVCVTPRKWSQTRTSYLPGKLITIVDVVADEYGQVLVTFV